MNLTSYPEIQDLLKRHNFRFSKSMGQNFLVKQWVPEEIADAAFCEGKTVLEIGPGIGCLTRELSLRADKVYSIELDKSLMPVLSETLIGCENVEVVFADALRSELPRADVVCANLPYNITTPILTKLVRGNYAYITVMIQREVADRICASEGNKDYGSFGIYVQWFYECEKLFDVTPDCFMPQPKVTSTVIRLKKREEKICGVNDEELMFKIIRASFNQRRKTLTNALHNAGIADKADTEAVLNKLGFDSQIRGEVLSIVDFAKICDELHVKS